MSERGRGRGGAGQGRGRGRGRGQGHSQTIKNLERATADIQNMLHDMKVCGSGGSKRRGGGGSRGSKSLMGFSGQSSHPNPPNQPFSHPGPPNHGYNQYCPPGQAPPYQHPPGQGLYHHGPPPQQTCHPRSYSEGGQYPPAPPSYEESMADYGTRPEAPVQGYCRKSEAPRREACKSAQAQELVKALAMFEGQMADSVVISRQIESSVEQVEKVVRQRKDLFAYIKDGNKMMVELVPNIKLCTHYFSESGCTEQGSCQALHFCKDFILTRCDLGASCTFGHKFDTNHNNAILSKLYLDLIRTHNLLLIVKKVCRGSAPPRMCDYYTTKDGCRNKDNCKFLHICKDYVMNDGKCPAKNCPFNHQLTNKQCKDVLAQRGVSTNDSIRDILWKLKQVLERDGSRHSSHVAKQDKKKGAQEESEDSSDSCQDTAAAFVKKTKKPCGRTKEKCSQSKQKKATDKTTTITLSNTNVTYNINLSTMTK